MTKTVRDEDRSTQSVYWTTANLRMLIHYVEQLCLAIAEERTGIYRILDHPDVGLRR